MNFRSFRHEHPSKYTLKPYLRGTHNKQKITEQPNIRRPCFSRVSACEVLSSLHVFPSCLPPFAIALLSSLYVFPSCLPSFVLALLWRSGEGPGGGLGSRETLGDPLPPNPPPSQASARASPGPVGYGGAPGSQKRV